jgi:DNA-binding MurR/RpiR family transcriptional regulator
MENSILSLIRASYNALSQSQKRVADFVLRHPDRVMISSMNDLAGACGVSEPTIMRFLRKLHYNSYQVFRVNIAQELGTGSGKNVYYDEIRKTDSVEVMKDKLLAVTAQSLLDSARVVDAAALERIARLAERAPHILVIGMGSSCAQALDLVHKLQRLGLNAAHSNDSHMINILATNLREDDLLFAFSHSGESREILDGALLAGENGAHVAAVTSYPNSSLVSLCEEVLLSSSHETSYRSDAMTSRIIQMAIIDMIYICIAMHLGDEAEENINRTRMAVARNKT